MKKRFSYDKFQDDLSGKELEDLLVHTCAYLNRGAIDSIQNYDWYVPSNQPDTSPSVQWNLPITAKGYSPAGKVQGNLSPAQRADEMFELVELKNRNQKTSNAVKEIVFEVHTQMNQNSQQQGSQNNSKEPEDAFDGINKALEKSRKKHL